MTNREITINDPLQKAITLATSYKLVLRQDHLQDISFVQVHSHGIF